MHKTFLVAQREYVENIKTKGFWVGILVFPVMLTLFIVVPTLLERATSARRYAVVDESGWLLQAVEHQVISTDLARAFQETVARRQTGERFDELPAALQNVAPALMELDDTQLAAAAAAVAASSGGPDATGPHTDRPRQLERVLRHRDALLAWWRDLAPSDARRLSDLSKSQYQRVDVPVSDTLSTLNRMINEGELFAYFVVSHDPVVGTDGSKYVSNNLTDDALKDWFAAIASDIIRARRLERERIDPAVAQWIQQPLRFEERKVTGAGEEAQVEAGDTLRQWAPVVFVYLLWIAVFTVSQMLLTNTIEEKSNRTIEVLLSSVSPLQLMAGKIAGIAATGLTLVGSWIMFSIVSTRILPRVLDAAPSLDLSALATDPIYLGSFIAYFLLGFLLYAAILVGIGSVVNTLKEAQNLMMPVTLLLIAPLLAMVPIGKDPNGTLAQILSYIPPFTPFVMMNRAAGPPTGMEYLLTTVLLVVAIGAAMWAAAKVFRIGILLTGKPPRPSEILRWIKAPVGVVPERK